MKKHIFIFIYCLLYMSRLAIAQSTDTVQLRVWYTYQTITDTANNKGFSERMRLDIGNHFSKYYSENKSLSDSIGFAQQNGGMSVQEILNNRFLLPKYQISETVFKNAPYQNKISFFNTIFIQKYLYYENTPIAPWQIENETQEILGYNVQKATMRYAGRNYTAWFAPDIPISDGPWKFSGLPGLILKIEDSQGYFSFTAIGLLKSPNNGTSTISTEKLYNQNNLYIVDRTKYLEYHQKYKANPYAILGSMGIKRTGLNGQPAPERKQPPYNLMEKHF